MTRITTKRLPTFTAISAALMLSACAPSIADNSTAPSVASQIAPRPAIDQAAIAAALKESYLGPTGLPDANTIVGPPPELRTPAHDRDFAASRAGQLLHKTPRYTLAAQDADLFVPSATAALSCAAGFDISPQTTPAVDQLLRRSMMDFGLAPSAAKKKYNRARPFVENGQSTCTPHDEEFLRKDGSYPSGHSAIGYGWSLVLAQLLPERADKLLARGRAFGESRRICNVHWKSDIEAGRSIAQAVAPALQSSERFQADFAAAKAEIAAAKAKGKPVLTHDCRAEKRALALDRN